MPVFRCGHEQSDGLRQKWAKQDAVSHRACALLSAYCSGSGIRVPTSMCRYQMFVGGKYQMIVTSVLCCDVFSTRLSPDLLLQYLLLLWALDCNTVITIKGHQNYKAGERLETDCYHFIHHFISPAIFPTAGTGRIKRYILLIILIKRVTVEIVSAGVDTVDRQGSGQRLIRSKCVSAAALCWAGLGWGCAARRSRVE